MGLLVENQSYIVKQKGAFITIILTELVQQST